MGKLRVYLDNCCFNRPYDDQTQLRIELETKAKLFIQRLVLQGKLDLAWSYMLDYENVNNSHYQKRIAIAKWKQLSCVDVNETPEILDASKNIQSTGIKNADAIHIACALYSNCNFFITTDDRALRYVNKNIIICDPVMFLRYWEAKNYDA